MPKPNYKFEKYKKDQAKKQKKEAKRLRKLEKKNADKTPLPDESSGGGEAQQE